jgi:hypothetical protein
MCAGADASRILMMDSGQIDVRPISSLLFNAAAGPPPDETGDIGGARSGVQPLT